jgi:anti-sigma28 factor (negative regulator of flagellin synthesis)
MKAKKKQKKVAKNSTRKPAKKAAKKAVAKVQRGGARQSWLSEGSSLPTLDEKVAELKHFVDAMADGYIDNDELAAQEGRLVAAMKAVEGDLDDAQHAEVTTLLLELTAYNIMHVLHDMAREKVRQAFG